MHPSLALILLPKTTNILGPRPNLVLDAAVGGLFCDTLPVPALERLNHFVIRQPGDPF
jgi:hypothetical protein